MLKVNVAMLQTYLYDHYDGKCQFALPIKRNPGVKYEIIGVG
jgi:hypothetical protein